MNHTRLPPSENFLDFPDKKKKQNKNTVFKYAFSFTTKIIFCENVFYFSLLISLGFINFLSVKTFTFINIFPSISLIHDI